MMRRKSPNAPRRILNNGNSTTTPKHLTAPSVLSPTISGYSHGNDDHSHGSDQTMDVDGSGGRLNSMTHDFRDGNEGGSTPDFVRTRAAIEHTYQKISKTKELIKEAQNERDENVNEYLKLAASADKQQLQRIKNVFEKRNLKAAQSISQLQKKLETYNKRIRDLETHGLPSSHWQPREVLRDVGQGLKDVGVNIKEGITGFSGGVVGNIKGGLSGLTEATHSAAATVMAKPREFAHLIKNRFGSADNISSLEKLPPETAEPQPRNIHGSATFMHCNPKYGSDEESSSFNSGSAGQIAAGSGSPRRPVQRPEPASQTALVREMEPFLQELRERREEYQHLVEEIETLKTQVQQEYTFFNQSLHDERYRYERLEEQMNDLIELHQNEIENLKQGLGDVEEKVQYQSEERMSDVHEVLESCQARISRMEHQQQQHLQQLVSLDSLDGSNARALALKLINVLLTVLQVILLLVATVASILMPFIQTRLRILTTAGFIMSMVMLCRQWPELVDWGRQMIAQHVNT